MRRIAVKSSRIAPRSIARIFELSVLTEYWRRILKLAVALVVGLILQTKSFAEELPNIRSSLSNASVQVAEPFAFDLIVKAPAGAKVQFPSLGAQLGDFDVVDSQDLFDLPEPATNEIRTWTKRLTLESIRTGDLAIPSLQIEYKDGNRAQSLRSDPITVRVISVLEDRADPTKFRDIRPVVDVAIPPTKSNAWIGWTLGGFSTVVLASLAVAFFAKRRPWTTPANIALQKLDALANDLQRSQVGSQDFGLRVSAILREYLHLQFSLPQLGETSHELLDELQKEKCMDAAIAGRLDSLLALADQTKFAGLQLSHGDLQDALTQSRGLVERTANGSNARGKFAETNLAKGNLAEGVD